MQDTKVVAPEFKNTREALRKGMKAARKEIETPELLIKVLNAFVSVYDALEGRNDGSGD